MASQSSNLIGQEEEHELVAFGTRQSKGPTPQSRPNSRMEEMLSQLTKSQAEANKTLEAKVSSTDDKLSHIAYTQIEQIAEMSDLVDRISTVERSLQGSPFTGLDLTRRTLTPPMHALMASAPYTLALTTPLRPIPWRGPKRPNRPIYYRRQLSLYAEAYTLRDETESQFI